MFAYLCNQPTRLVPFSITIWGKSKLQSTDMKKALLLLFILFTGLCFVSCSDISETKLKGEWVASDVTFILNGEQVDWSYYGLVYSLSFKDDNTVVLRVGTYFSDEGWKLEEDDISIVCFTVISNYYVEDGVVHCSFKNREYIYSGGDLVFSNQGDYGLDETIVHYKKK